MHCCISKSDPKRKHIQPVVTQYYKSSLNKYIKIKNSVQNYHSQCEVAFASRPEEQFAAAVCSSSHLPLFSSALKISHHLQTLYITNISRVCVFYNTYIIYTHKTNCKVEERD